MNEVHEVYEGNLEFYGLTCLEGVQWYGGGLFAFDSCCWSQTLVWRQGVMTYEVRHLWSGGLVQKGSIHSYDTIELVHTFVGPVSRSLR